MAETWKSPRRVEEEVRDYKRSRFEWYMTEADEGRMERALALTALKEEMENIVELEDERLLRERRTG